MTRTGKFIGLSPAGDKVYVTAELRKTPAPQQSVTHETLPAGTITLALTGEAYAPYQREPGTFGQVCLEGLQWHPACGISKEDHAKITEVWARWSLSDLHAGCVHQTFGPEVPIDDRLGQVCPETGYKYGSAWLVEAVPGEIIEYVQRVFGATLPQETP